MHRRIVACGLLLVLARVAGAVDVAALAYHDVVPQPNGDAYAVTIEQFKRHMAYLARAGYQPISLRALERAHEGKETLPRKPVLLTFDDGYQSYYDIVYPTLREYGFPSVISLVTSWIDRRATPEYTAARFMTWDELRGLARSPLVEVLSHTDDLHRNVTANPFGARVPAAVARLYDERTGRYETEAAHRTRVSADLARSVQRLREELGIVPVGVTWPYGRYDRASLDAAAALGLRYYLTLDAEPTTLADLPRINRVTFRDRRALSDLDDALTLRSYRRQQWRFVTFDLAAFADADRAAQARRIVDIEQRAEVLRANAVVLRPFTADGKRALFHTDAMPVAADVLSQIGYRLDQRAGISNLIVRLPATLAPGVYADLARLNGFNAALIEGDDPVEFQRAADALRAYRPALRVGVQTIDAGAPVAADFSLIDVSADAPAGAIAQTVERAQHVARRAYFLIERTPTTSTAALRDAMAALRLAGATDFGYGPDGYAHDAPPFLQVVRPLAAYTIPAARR